MGNAMALPSCTSCSSADVMCVSRLGGGCGGGGGKCGPAAAAAVVVHTGWERLLEVGEGATAAEVMMEYPHHFVVSGDSPELAPGRRPAALAAHQELLPGRLYFALPMQKLRGRLSAQDIVHMAQLAQRLLKRSPRPARDDYFSLTAPSAPPRPPPPQPSLLSSFLNRTPPPAAHMWRPSLQTIDETPHLRSWTFREGLLMA